ncbi:hypothetical protein ABZ135_22020 [Streptomyces sp. NPDC006339]|uniref:hypothetical protein n=1 Tax=Streptomyces sp. NPDC006339 TaxID=3156755 RepID=UPI0033B79246
MPVPDARVELQIAGAWTDVTDYVVQATGVQLSCGRYDEGRTVDPGSGALTLLSPAGRFSNRNPYSPYFGLLPRNTPIRISTTAGETVLETTTATPGGRIATPDHASLDITGDIDIRVDVEPETWTAANFGLELIGKHAAAGQRSWRLSIGSGGQPRLTWSADGTNIVEWLGTVSVPFGPHQRGAVRATLDVNNGLGGYTVTYYTAPTIAGPWTHLDQLVTTGGTTSIFNSTAPMEIGDIQGVNLTATSRRFHAAEVRNGIGGTVVASPAFSGQTPGATSFVDSAGRTWTTAAGATITDRRTRVVHSVPTWPARWHVSGHDQRAPIQTAGILRRLGQGKKPLDSTLRRRIPSYSPLAYWPCEDGATATQAYSPIARVSPLRVTGFTFDQDDSLAGSAALPAVDAGATIRGTVPGPTSSTTAWAVTMVYNTDTAPASEQEWLSWRSTGSVRRWRITQGPSSSHLYGYDATGGLLVDSGLGTGSNLYGSWQRLSFSATQDGSNVDWEIRWTGVSGSSGAISGTYAGTVGTVSQIDTQIGTVTGLRLGHIAVFTSLATAITAYDFADHGYNGERARDRLTRLATEESETVSVTIADRDATRDTEKLGPQRPGVLLDLLQDAADVDGGILYEDPERSALVYRTRTSMENQVPKLVLDYGALAPPFEPTESDLNLRNIVEVTRDGGSSGIAVVDEGPLTADEIGVYDESVTLPLYNDEQAPIHAGWRLHLASWDEARYPTVHIMLHKSPELIPQVAALQVGDRIQITGTPAWMPPGPVDLIVQRIDDDIRTHTWDVTLTCSPAGPWTVGVVDDPELGRADTDGCTLAVGVDADDTSWSVTSAGARWINSAAYPTEFPFDWTVGGEVVTVTAITGTTSSQTATVIRAVNGVVKAHTAGAPIQLAQPAHLAL